MSGPHVFTRGKAGGAVLSGMPALAPLEGVPSMSSLHSAVFSADGRYMAALDLSPAGGGARVHAVGGDWPIVLRVERPAVTAIAFSPFATFVVTWEKLVDDSDGNLLVWRLSDGSVASRLKQKSFARDKWPSTPWSADESLCAQLATGEVQFHDGHEGPGVRPPIARLKLPNVSKFQLAPSSQPAQRIATFVPEHNGGPAMVRVYEYPRLEAGAYVRQKAFYKAQSVELKWAPSGVGLLVLAHTDEDKSNRSYYGETSLFYVPASKEGTEGNVPRVKEGPVHDVAWSPMADVFCCVHGFMPAVSIIYNAALQPVFRLGTEAPRNTVRWSPHGHLLALGGFGNVGGGLDFWDVEQRLLLNSVDAHMTVGCEWAADSEHLLTSTLFPRLRVENGYKLWAADGRLLDERRIDELSEATLAPAQAGAFAKPKPRQPAKPGAVGGASGAGAGGAAAAAKPAGKYVPPSRRGQPGADAGFDIHAYDPSADRDGRGPIFAQRGLPVGADPADAGRGRGKGGRGGGRGAAAPSGAAGRGGAVAAAAATAAGAAAVGSGEGGAATSEAAKKAKAVGKKLRQIAELQEALDAGKVLEKNQLDKISARAELEAELAALTVTMAEEAKTGLWR
ncbi:hypothetical protein KFE25_012247 [Diacronema lutheri]|uniref:Eukaryotic translation initiation factor 2A n=1 Tax=Diacronema lutheri TaxID=2081491 RepID=A0A8J6C596_DIALT|nr:hypothetical protein KFE25_012247 [Diacronema lutheri]